MGSMCHGSQECFDFGATFHIGTRIFHGGPIPSCNFLLEGQWELCWKWVTKQGDCICHISLEANSTQSLFMGIMYVSYLPRVSQAQDSPLPSVLYRVMLELGTCKLYFPQFLLAHVPFGSLDRGLESGKMKLFFLFPDPVRHLPEARQLWLQPPASFSTPGIHCGMPPQKLTF